MPFPSKPEQAGARPPPADAPTAFAVGYAFAEAMQARTLVVGRDCRAASGAVVQALIRGAQTAGVDVCDIGECTTDMMTYALATEGPGMVMADCGIMLTATVGPDHSTGFRFYGAEGAPVAPKTLAGVWDMVEAKDAPLTSPLEGCGDSYGRNLYDDYPDFLVRTLVGYGDWPKTPGRRPFKVVIDGGVSLAPHLFSRVIARLNLVGKLEVVQLSSVDHAYIRTSDPRHESRRDAMQKAVHLLAADLGIAWSADGGRVVFYDDRGDPCPGPYIGACLAATAIEAYPDDMVLVDHRYVFPMVTTVHGAGTPLGFVHPGVSRMKTLMRDTAACFGAEASGHYYFRDFWWADNSTLAAVLTTQMAYLAPIRFSEVMGMMRKTYPILPEKAYAVPDPDAAIAAVMRAFSGITNTEMTDGELVMRTSYGAEDWRVVVRVSRTTGHVVYTVEGAFKTSGLGRVAREIERVLVLCGGRHEK